MTHVEPYSTMGPQKRLVARTAALIMRDLRERRAEYVAEKQAAGGWLDRCVHGTYIGTWAGPDYMCGTCEDGTPDWFLALAAAHSIHAAVNHRQKSARAAIKAAEDVGEPLPEHVRRSIVDWMLEPMDSVPEPRHYYLP